LELELLLKLTVQQQPLLQLLSKILYYYSSFCSYSFPSFVRLSMLDFHYNYCLPMRRNFVT
jgi:hypothetical protein